MATELLTPTPEADAAEVGATAERLFAAGATALETLTIALGRRLGLYAALARRPGGSTADELATAAGIHPRYAQEWLEQQAAAEILDVDDAAAASDARRYTICAALQATLLDPDSPASLGPLVDAVAGLGEVLPRIVEAYRTGGGVPYAAYPSVSAIQAAFNAPLFAGPFAHDFIPAVPGLAARLADDPPARVAELGTGSGGGALAIAHAWPKATIDGFDLDGVGLEDARAAAVAQGVAEQVRFTLADVAQLPVPDHAYDLVFAVEVVHDLPRPVAALEEARRIAKPDGVVVVFDERTPDAFTAPSDDPIERLFYAMSVLHCLPATMASFPLANRDGAATGTVMRADTLRSYARDAGFLDVEVLPIEHDMMRGYLLR